MLLEPLITWPGRPDYEPPPPIQPLSGPQKEQFELGRVLYEASCASCHQKSGLGLEGQAPPLAESEWVLGSPERLIRIVLHGVKGPIHVGGRRYEQLEMPALNAFDDQQIAAILTYIRREWEHGADPVSADSVQRIRAATANRSEAWTEAELLKIK